MLTMVRSLSTRFAPNRGLSARRPKKCAGLVEQAEHLNVPDLLERLTPEERRTREVYVPPEAPNVVLVRIRKGALPWFWYSICPRCRRRCESLHRPSWALPGDWRCVRCHNLTYASRRYGKSEASLSRRMHRRNPGYRTRQRIARERKAMVLQAARTRGPDGAARGRAQREAKQVRVNMAEMLPEVLAHMKAGKPILVAADPTTGPRVLDYDAVVAQVRAETEREEEMRRAVAEAVEDNDAVLARYSPRSRALKVRAARLFDRVACFWATRRLPS